MLSGVTIVSKADAERELRREAKRDKKRDKKKEKKKRKDSKKRHGGGGGSSTDDASDDDRDRRERSSEPRDTSGGDGVPRDVPVPSSAPAEAPSAREDWMTSGTSFGEEAAKARDPRSSSRVAREEAAARSAAVAAERELNPHWANGGDGFKPNVSSAPNERSPKAETKNALLTAGASGGVGDGGASWRLKALRRAKERAAEEGRSLAEVVSDRWGSVSDLVDSIGGNAANKNAHLKNARRDDARSGCFRCGEEGHFARECPKSFPNSVSQEFPDGGGAGARADKKRPRDRLERPLADEDIARAAKAQARGNADDRARLDAPRMRKPPGLGAAAGPGASDRRVAAGTRAAAPSGGETSAFAGFRTEDRRLVASAARAANAFESDGSFFAKASAASGPTAAAATHERTEERRGEDEAKRNESANEDAFPSSGPRAGSETLRAQPSRASAGVAPNARASGAPSANVSAAAALRAKLMGSRKTAASADEAPNAPNAQARLPLVDEEGRAAPGAFGRATTLRGGVASAEGAVRRAPKTTQRFDPETKEKVRYYRDDDGATLRDLVAAEKHGGGALDDYDANFFQNVASDKRYKGSKTERERDEAVDDEYDNDLGLEMYEKRDKKQSHAKQQEKARQRQVAEYERSRLKLASCALCLDNPRKPLKHLHVAYGNHAYLMLPASGRLVPGHCVIAPIAHCRGSRACDEQTWEEMRNFKKCLTKMFAAQGKEACFLETCVWNGGGGSGGGDIMHAQGGLGSRFESSSGPSVAGNAVGKSRRGGGGASFASTASASSHGRVECVPIPSRVAADAPAYFKKAIDESESEWSTHAGKRCLSTAPPKGLRQSIPDNFPYFHVEFNMRGGFAHVVDDETRWNKDFGRDVLVGLLGLPENASGAKKRALPPAALKREMDAFLDAWEPVDWTKQL